MRWPKGTLPRLLIAATVVHAGVVALAVWRTGSVSSYAFRSPDSGEYYNLARNLAHHAVFSQDVEPPYRPDTWRTPGYPLFLAAGIVLFGDTPVAPILLQQAISIVNVLLLYAAALRLMSRRAAAFAALAFLLEPYHLLYSLWLLPTTLLISLLLTAWLCWQSALESRVWGWFALLGVISGALVLIWPGTILIPVGVFLGIALGAGVRRLFTPGSFARWAWFAMVAFLVPLLSIVGLWMQRNDNVAGHAALSNQSGVVLAYFKAAEVILWQQGRTQDRYLELSTDTTRADLPHSVWSTIDRDLQARFRAVEETQRRTLIWQNLAQGNMSGLDPFVVSRALTHLARGYFLEAPLATAACLIVRVGENLVFPLSLALQPAAGIGGDRTGHLLRAAPYLLLVLLVAWRFTRPGLNFSSAYFPLLACTAIALAVTPQIEPRFRALMIPFLVTIVLMPRHPGGTNHAEEEDEDDDEMAGVA